MTLEDYTDGFRAFHTHSHNGDDIIVALPNEGVPRGFLTITHDGNPYTCLVGCDTLASNLTADEWNLAQQICAVAIQTVERREMSGVKYMA